MSARERSSIDITSLRPSSTGSQDVPDPLAGCRRPRSRALVASAVRENFKGSTASDDRDLIRNHVVRVEVQADQLAIELKAAKAPCDPRNAENDRLVLRIQWKKTSMKRRREIIVPASVSPHDRRLIRAETRATLVAAIARGRRWLAELIAGAVSRA